MIDRLVGTAEFSPCRRYRFRLTRTWNRELPPLALIGLNPSTADASNDDPTIRRCIRFARDHGHGGIIMVNLFAFRATNPRDLLSAEDPIGPGNDNAISFSGNSNRCVLAWGAEKPFMRERAAQVRDLLTGPLWCLGRTKDGSPRHPLYVRADKRLERLDCDQASNENTPDA